MREDWTTTTLGEIAHIRIGRTPPRKEPRYWTDDLTRPFCTITDMDAALVMPGREGVTERAEREGLAKRVPAGSLLMSFKLTIGRVGIAAVDVFPNEAIAWLEPSSPSVDKRFLGLWLGAFDVAASAGRAVKGNTLNGKSLRAIAVSFPPLAEQRRIVDLIGAVDEARSRAVAERTAALQAAAAVIDTTLRGAASTVRLGDHAIVRGGKRLPKGTPWAEQPTAHPYIRVVDMKGGTIDPSALVHVPDRVWQSIRRYVVEANDVVISIVGTIGEVALVPQSLAGANLTENAALIRVAPSLDASFLTAFLQSQWGRAELARLTVGTTQAKLALFRIESIEVPLLTLRHQQGAGAAFAEFRDVAVAAEREVSALSALRAVLTRSLLGGEVAIPESYDRFLDGAA